MTSLRASLHEQCSPAEALARSAVLLDAAGDGDAHLSASVVHGPAVVLGARQRAGRVVDLDACEAAGVAVLRRVTTGPALAMPPTSIVWALSLPHVAALVPDATLATLLNRNVRLFLKGLLAAGAQAAYFGRDDIAVRRQAAVSLGYEVTRDGRVLIEAIAGCEVSTALPPSLTAPEERAIDRARGKEPVALLACVRDTWTPVTLARRVVEGVAERADADLLWEITHEARALSPVRDALDPLPAGSRPTATVVVPIGYVEGATGPWLGGDALTATWWLDALARAVAEGSELPAPPVLEGARVEDLVAALDGAADSAAR
jgi:hypothetical protein